MKTLSRKTRQKPKTTKKEILTPDSAYEQYIELCEFSLFTLQFIRQLWYNLSLHHSFTKKKWTLPIVFISLCAWLGKWSEHDLDLQWSAQEQIWIPFKIKNKKLSHLDSIPWVRMPFLPTFFGTEILHKSVDFGLVILPAYTVNLLIYGCILVLTSLNCKC